MQVIKTTMKKFKTMKKNQILSIILLICVSVSAQFTQRPLSYAYNALEPFVDAQTMEIHYSKHHATYVKNLNTAVIGTDAEKMTIAEIFSNTSKLNTAIKNNAGGHFNHEFFWSILTPEKNTKPSADLEKAINQAFGKLETLKDKLNTAGASRFGSGWVWLYVGQDGKLAICTTANQDNPLMDTAENKGMPILAIDVWEHAYYLKYQNKRADYLTAIWNVINWSEVNNYYATAIPKKKGKFDGWQELKDFHQVMSQTFHPSEDGNLKPIKERIGEMVQKAESLTKSTIPTEFNSKEVIQVTKDLETDAKKLDKMIKVKANDEKIKLALEKLHDTFHKIIGLCTNEDKH
jgi:superoxide dismutase